MLYPVLRIIVGYDASFDLHILCRHLEVFFLAPAAEVITRRYFRRRSYCHVASVFITLFRPVWLTIQLICHVVTVDLEAAADYYVLGTHLIRQRSVPAAECVAFLRRFFSQVFHGLIVFVSVYLSILLAVYHVSYCMLISSVVQLQDEFSVPCDGPFRYVLFGSLVIGEACKGRRICSCYRIRLSIQGLRQAFLILPVQAFQIVYYCILRISVGCERSRYLHVIGRHLKGFLLAPAAECVALFHCIRLNAYLLAVFIALRACICRSVHLVGHVVTVPCVVQLQCQASVTGYRSGCQRILSGFCIIRKAFILLRSFCHRRSRRSSLVSAFRQCKRSVQVLFIMLYPVLRIIVGYDASFDLHILCRHLEVFFLAPAAEVITRRYLRRRSY